MCISFLPYKTCLGALRDQHNQQKMDLFGLYNEIINNFWSFR